MFKNIVFYLLLAFTIATPTYAGFQNKLYLATILAVVGVVCLLALRLEDLIKIKLWGLEAELAKKIDETNATLEQLKALAKAISEPSIVDLAMHGSMFHHVNFSYRYEMKKRIDEALIKIGVNINEQKDINDLWNTVVRQGIAHLIVSGIAEYNPELTDKLKQLNTKNDGEPATPEEYQAFLKEYGLIDDERAKWIDDYEYFLKNGIIRRPELWPVGFEPQ